MSLNAASDQLRRNVELTGLQQSTVATRQRSVRNALAEELVVKDDFLTGSYVRQTLIGPLKKADVDVLVILDQQYVSRGARNVLDMVRRVLVKTYTRTPAISRNGQAVTVTFRDFKVDVAPAFERSWWEGGGHRICDSGSNDWIETNPKRHIEISSEANRVHHGSLVPCIKQLKAWNRTVNCPLRSFHIEVLAWEIFGRTPWPFGHAMGSDWVNARYFFDKVRQRIPQRQPDPAGTGVDVGGYLGGQALEDAVSKANTAYERCVRAENAAASGQPLADWISPTARIASYSATTTRRPDGNPR